MRITLKSYFENDPAKKDIVWAETIVSHLRIHMKPLVNAMRYSRNMEYLFGTYKMDEYKKMFKDPENAGVSWQGLALMEKMKNVLTAEAENSGINIHLKAIDPTAVNQRDRDKKLLAARKTIEGMMSYLRKSIGLPGFSLAAQKDKGGKSLFSGNVEGFDKMGLDASNEEDLNYYFANFYRLMHEIKAEEPINYYIKFNELTEQISFYLDDILAVKAIASKAYVNDISGSIDIKYLNPTSVRVIPNKRRDFKDAPGIMYEENVTVQDLIKMIGNEFNPSIDLEIILRASNFTNGTAYQAINDGEGYLVGNEFSSITCSYSEFLEFKVGMGYIEWKSNDATAYKITESNAHGNIGMYPRSLNWEPEDNRFQKRTWNIENTYKAYYISLGVTQQRLYKYGKLAYQVIEGAEDEYSSFSIMAFRERGKSAVEVAIPHIKIIEKAFKKREHLISMAKGDGRAYNYESLVRIAQHMFPKEEVRSGVNMVIKMFFDGVNEIWTIPLTSDEKPVGGGGTSSFEIRNGMSTAVPELQRVIIEEAMAMADKFGMGGPRDGSNPGERAGFKINNLVSQGSQNATQYIRSMMINMHNQQGKRILSFVQDIIAFKDKSSLPYKHMLHGLGDETMEDLESLGNVALHRYGIFVESMNTQSEREEVKAMAQQALQNKDISYEQYLLICSIVNPHRAIQILAYEKKRTERVQRENAQAAQQAADASRERQYQHELELEKIKEAGEYEREKVRGEYYYLSHKQTADAMIQKEGMKNDQKTNDIQNKTIADTDKRIAEANVEAQKPLPI